jgi:DNA modification methylase
MNDLYKDHKAASGPVECLGQTFPSEEARCAHFLKQLAEKLKDNAFRMTGGFPKGTDEAILAMSDPPYYTACPNPWLAEIVAKLGRPYVGTDPYAREPMAIDASVGKTDTLYKAHGYHTKVPHLAIVPSILHYTEPGDLVLDGFAGSGMTGVAAQWCGLASAGYKRALETEWKQAGVPPPKWGVRCAILTDLSPAATFIAANYNHPFDVTRFLELGEALLSALQGEIGWMYETLHPGTTRKGRIDFTVWSEVFTCPNCGAENVFLDSEKVETEGERDRIKCHSCGAEARKEEMDLAKEQHLDQGSMNWRPKRVPVQIQYRIGKDKLSKKPDENDLQTLRRISDMGLPPTFPSHNFRDSKTFNEGRMRTTNTRALHDLFLPRAARAVASMWALAQGEPDRRMRHMLQYFVEQAIIGLSTINRYSPSHFSQVNRNLNGVLYVGSQHSECSPWYVLEGKLSRIAAAFGAFRASREACFVGTSSSSVLSLPDNSIDYVFVDPPFGFNIYYADLNAAVENWHGVVTSLKEEAVIDDYAGKDLIAYERAMRGIFSEYFRVLKPGRWMTVVFSNSQSSVWNAIQIAFQQSGFVVAEVSTLDKKQGSFKQVTSRNTVKQDLVISAYKPNGGLEQRFAERGATPESAWDFVRTHLKQLSVTKMKNNGLEFIVERDPRRVYDRMVAWFVRHDAPVPLSTDEFLSGLRSRFPERDGMAFLPEQIAAYDKKRAQVAQAPQMELFVSDERSAIDWLADFLKQRPSTYQELHPEFITQIGAGWKKHEAKPELAALLENNFLKYDGTGDVPSQIHSYLSTNHKDLRGLDKSNPQLIQKAQDRWYIPDPNKAIDLEKKREKALLKEFDAYQASTGRKLKEFRLEVLRAGFKVAWTAKNYKTIIAIAQKIPQEALQEDEKLLLWYDQALTRAEAGA